MGKQEMKARDTRKRHAQDAQARENCKRHTRGRIVHCLSVQTVVSRKEMLQYGQKGKQMRSQSLSYIRFLWETRGKTFRF